VRNLVRPGTHNPAYQVDHADKKAF
jgi:hypothetical protein